MFVLLVPLCPTSCPAQLGRSFACLPAADGINPSHGLVIIENRVDLAQTDLRSDLKPVLPLSSLVGYLSALDYPFLVLSFACVAPSCDGHSKATCAAAETCNPIHRSIRSALAIFVVSFANASPARFPCGRPCRVCIPAERVPHQTIAAESTLHYLSHKFVTCPSSLAASSFVLSHVPKRFARTS